MATACCLAACSATAPQDTALPTFPPVVAVPVVIPADLALIPYTSPPRVTGRQRPACVARANGMLPDPACTPGSVGETDVTKVCAAGFSDAHRPADVRAARSSAMAAYRVSAVDLERVEYDHLVPLSLGGSNDVSNLWPQVSDLPGAGIHNSKDDVEYRLWRAVCVRLKGDPRRQETLITVQQALARDWTAAEKFLPA